MQFLFKLCSAAAEVERDDVFELQSHAEEYQVNKLVVTQLIFENYLGFNLVAQP